MTETTQVPQTRRRLLAGALGGIAALAAGSLARPAATDAANGDTVKVGGSFSATGTTQITTSGTQGIRGNSTATNGMGLYGRATGTGGRGVRGDSTSGSGIGVLGYDVATSGTPVGVKGVASGVGIGVYGFGGRGVKGETNTPGGVGVVASNTAVTGSGSALSAVAFAPAGTGVYAENNAQNGIGTALHAKSVTTVTARVENVSNNEVAVALEVLADTGTGVSATAPTAMWASTPDPLAGEAVAVRGTGTLGGHIGGYFENLVGGFALDVDGGLRVKKAGGTALVVNGASSVIVNALVRNPTYNNSDTQVLATLISDPGANVGVTWVQLGASTFTIHLSGAVTKDCTVAFLMWRAI